MGVPAASSASRRPRPTTARATSSSRARDRISPSSFDDPRAAQLHDRRAADRQRHGNAPPGHALRAPALVDNVVGYTVYGDYDSRTAERIVDAVGRRRRRRRAGVGAAGRLFRAPAGVPLRRRAGRAAAGSARPAVRLRRSRWACARGDNALRDALDDVLERRHADIDRILRPSTACRASRRHADDADARPLVAVAC